jgi:hypothetical protein
VNHETALRVAVSRKNDALALGVFHRSGGFPFCKRFNLSSTMPRDGSLTLSDIREPTLAIGCERCGRHGRYNVQRLTWCRRQAD